MICKLNLFAVLVSGIFAAVFVNSAALAESFDCTDCHTNVKIVSPVHDGVGCSDCHSNIKNIPHQKNPLATLGGKQICLQCHDTEVNDFKTSVHSQQNCSACHGSIHKGWQKAEQACGSCHAKPMEEFQTATHSKKGVKCIDCHGNPHKILKASDLNSSVFAVNQPQTCGKCHGSTEAKSPLMKGAKLGIVEGFLKSNHGKGLTASGLAGVAPTCSTCHGSHAIYAKNNPHSKITSKNVPNLCGSCHKGVLELWKKSTHGELWEGGMEGPICITCHGTHEIIDPRIGINRIHTSEKCSGCHEKRYETYRDTFHGKATDLGFVQGAACSDCHTAHMGVPATDARSTVNPANLQKTCSQCHGQVTAAFIQFKPHIDPHDKGAGLIHWLWLGMTGLLVGTFAFFIVHTLLWLQRAVVALSRHELHSIPRQGDKWVRRFRPLHQWVHVTIILTFLTLASTGLPLKFHFVGLAATIAKLLGGVTVARYFHHLAGVATFGYGIVFIGYLIREIVVKKRYELLWGWKSMTPNPKDLKDIFDNVRWFLYMGPPPKLDRWTYWEKFDFFAVFWGVMVIGFSGLMLWFPTFVTHFLPGWVLNIAAIVHGDEALLATGFIFFFHFFHTHMRPENFPIDTVMFTGGMPLERLKEERPAEYEHLVKTGELEKQMMPAPSANRMKVAYTFGFFALFVGLMLGFLLLVAAFKVMA